MNLEHKYIQRLLTVLANTARIFVAFTFILSGFLKANDITGTVYKIQEYFIAWGWSNLSMGNSPTALAWILATIEFWIGVNLFFGIRYKTSLFFATLIMSVMTPITIWLAWSNAVADCGCFGDAIVLTHWETVGKNIVLLGALYVCIRLRHRVIKLVTDKVNWLIPLYSILYILLFMGYTSENLPIFDFRPYHIASNIRSYMEIPAGKQPTEYETTFLYQKGKEQKVFTIDALPEDSTWQFIDAQTRIKSVGYEPPIKDFHITAIANDEDISEQILNTDTYIFLLIAPWLAQADDSEMDRINSLYDYARSYNYPFYCITASHDEDIRNWEENTGAEYPFARMDATALKSMIRSNPGVLMIKKGVVINKWSDRNIPHEERLNNSMDKLPYGKINLRSAQRKAFELVMLFVLPLFVLSLLDLLWERWKRYRKRISTTNTPQTEI